MIPKLEYLEIENLHSQDTDLKKIGIFDEDYNFINSLNQFAIFEYDQFNFQKTISVRYIINEFIELLQGTYHKEFLLAELEEFNIEEELEDVCMFASRLNERLQNRKNLDQYLKQLNSNENVDYCEKRLSFKIEIEDIILDSIMLFIRLINLYIYRSSVGVTSNTYAIKRFAEIERGIFKRIIGIKFPETFDSSLITYDLKEESLMFGFGRGVQFIKEIARQSKSVLDDNKVCNSYVALLMNMLIIQNKGVYVYD